VWLDSFLRGKWHAPSAADATQELHPATGDGHIYIPERVNDFETPGFGI